MNQLIRGALAGTMATVPMTIAIWAGRKLDMLRTPPPAQITANVARRTEAVDVQSPEAFTATWLAAHVGFGAGTGALYALVRRRLPMGTGPAGLLFGGVVWAYNYLGIFPALNLYPSPEEDRNSRVAVMLAAHAVYGVSLAELERRLAKR